MKKIVIGIVLAAFLAISGSAQSATVFKKDNFQYDIKGDWQIQFRRDPGKDQDADIEYDDLEIKNSVSYKINDTVTAFGQLDFGFKNAADKSNSGADPHLEEAYLGFKINDVKLFVGKTDSAGDEFGVQGTIETIVADDCFDEFGAVDGDDIIGVSAKIADVLNVYATYELEAESESSDGNGNFFDIFISTSFKGFSLGAAYQTLEESGSDHEINTWGVQASYDAEFAEFFADYSVTDYDEADEDVSIWNVCVSVPVKPVTLTGGFVMLDPDAEGEEEVAGWYANVVYKFPTAKNVSLFAEISDSDEDEVDMGYLAGVRIKF